MEGVLPMNYKVIILCIILVMIVIYVVVSASRFSKDIKAAQSRLENIKTNVYHTQYGNIEYMLEGNDDDPVILMSHGITGGVDQGMGLAKTYFNKGYCFLYISRFGYLKSDLPDYATPNMQADAYHALLDYLEIDQAYILGNSAGGTSAFHFALEYKDRCKGLILLSTNLPQTNEVLPPKMIIKTIFGSNFMYWWTVQSFDSMLFKMFLDKSTLDGLTKKEKLDMRHNILMPGLPISERKDGVFYDMFVSNPSLNGSNLSYEGIQVPTLIIHAADDPGIPLESAKKVADKMNDVSLKVFDHGGHIFLGHEEEIKHTIDTFIMKNEGGE